MNLIFKKPYVIALSTSLLLFGGCDKKEPPPPAVKAPEEAKEKETIYLTQGRVNIYQLKGWTEGVVEILILDDLPDSLRETLTKQQGLLKAYMGGEGEKASGEATAVTQQEDADSSGNMDWLSEEDRRSLEVELAELKKQYPPPVESSLATTSGATRIYRVRDAVYSRYKPLVEAVRIDHIQDDLNTLFDKLREDYELLSSQAEGEGESANQAKADINWMAVFTDPYLQNFVGIVRRMDSMQRRTALRARREALAQRRTGAPDTSDRGPVELSPEEAWEKFMFENERQIDTRLFSLTKESGFAGEDGRFSVEGKGAVVARIEIRGRAVYFPADFKDIPIVYSEVEVVEQVEDP